MNEGRGIAIISVDLIMHTIKELCLSGRMKSSRNNNIAKTLVLFFVLPLFLYSGVSLGASVDVANGNLHHSQTLFELPGSTMQNGFTLSYNSLDSNRLPLGVGWTHNYNVQLLVSGDYAIVTESNGQRGSLRRNGTSYTPVGLPWPALTKNPDNTYLLSFKDGRKYHFSADGKITSIVDRNSNTTTLVYDAKDNLVTVTEPSKRVISIRYNASHLISSITDPDGNLHSFSYDGNTLIGIVSQTPAGKLTWTYTYTDIYNSATTMTTAYLHTKTDPNGRTTTYAYDDHAYYNRVVTVTDSEGKTQTVNYPGDTISPTGTTYVTGKEGGVTAYTYDMTNPTVTPPLTEKTDPSGRKTTYKYDSKGNITSETDSAGKTISYTYDKDNNVTSVTDYFNRETTFYSYNSAGQVTRMTDSFGNVTTYEYDAKGNLTRITEPSGQSYDFHNVPQEQTSP